MAKVIKSNADGSKEEYSGVDTSAGAGSAGEFVALDGAGKISTTMLPTGVGPDSISGTAGENLSAGDIVYINGSGQVLKADATSISKQARGYVLAAVTSGQTATVFFDDSNTSVTGLTPGATYYLSTTPGAITTTPTTTANQIAQEVGFATLAGVLRVNIQTPVIRK